MSQSGNPKNSLSKCNNFLIGLLKDFPSDNPPPASTNHFSVFWHCFTAWAQDVSCFKSLVEVRIHAVLNLWQIPFCAERAYCGACLEVRWPSFTYLPMTCWIILYVCGYLCMPGLYGERLTHTLSVKNSFPWASIASCTLLTHCPGIKQ